MTKISPNAARRISQSVTTVERMAGSRAQLGNRPVVNFGSYLVKTPSGGIPARSGTTLGTASCTIQVIDKTNDQISDGESVDVLNLSDTAIGGTTYIKAVRTKTGDYIAESSGTTVRNWCVGTASHDGNSYTITNFSTSDTSVFNAATLGGGGALTYATTTVDCIGYMEGTWNFTRTGDVLYVLRDGTGYVASINGSVATWARTAQIAVAGPAIDRDLQPPALTWYTASNPATSIPSQDVSFALSTPIQNVGTGGVTTIQPSINIGEGALLLPDFEDESYTINFSLIETPLPDLSAVNPSGGVQPLTG
jgi:hypothetical protein